ncbi:hypothetical protein EDB81DRAFT_148545 [Dactylonectria macrodidyma]|uniref:Uncharacterized protein n=1 Tax=Dactylonectria macrodidyma TaxID=307937 RepID=A0A9P9E0D9_9HYPO|nr:hypothetical protein EDB81DRAFT_148545 [Dactylonectria macrodidyma]
METISNAATAAAKAVWGDSTAQKEPVSGAKGDVSKGEPYDAGNLEPGRQEQVEQSLEGRHVDTAPIPYPREDTTALQSDTRDPAKGPRNESELQHVGTTTPGPTSKPSALESYDSRPSEGFDSRPTEHTPLNDNREQGRDQIPEAKAPELKTPGETVPETKFPESNLSETKVPDTEIPGAKASEPSSLEPTSSISKTKSEDSEESKGTGQEYVRTTGLAADGGNFDATKPGAGREADRLMEEKGIHHDGGDSSHSDKKDKPSLGERIKAKLHKH